MFGFAVKEEEVPTGFRIHSDGIVSRAVYKTWDAAESAAREMDLCDYRVEPEYS